MLFRSLSLLLTALLQFFDSLFCYAALQQAVYLLHRISKEYNLEIAAKKTKVFGFVGTDNLRTKIITNNETLEKVIQFTYLGCSISYQFSNDVEFKLAEFLQLIGNIRENFFF